MAYWNAALLMSSQHRAAYTELTAGKSDQLQRTGFETLLRSRDVAAISVALDWYNDLNSMTRHGIDNPLKEYGQEVLQVARMILRRPPILRSEEPLAFEDEANHASAVCVLIDLAEAGDAGLLADILKTSRSESVRVAAILASYNVVVDEPAPDDQIVDALCGILLNDNGAYEERSAALSTLASSQSTKARMAIVTAVELSDIRIQAQAILILIEDDFTRYRDLVERRVASWPEKVPYPATDVVAIIRDYQGKKDTSPAPSE